MFQGDPGVAGDLTQRVQIIFVPRRSVVMHQEGHHRHHKTIYDHRGDHDLAQPIAENLSRSSLLRPRGHLGRGHGLAHQFTATDCCGDRVAVAVPAQAGQPRRHRDAGYAGDGHPIGDHR
jgi:hypothetical protein